MKNLLFSLIILFSYSASAQCSLGFNDLIKALRNNETNLKYQLSNKGYIYNYSESTYFCDIYKYELRKTYKDGVFGIKYMIPNSSYEIKKIINEAKIYGLKLTDSTINPSTGMPNNIYTDGIGNLMMQIQSNESYSYIVIYGQ
jgi:hypothetical protein